MGNETVIKALEKGIRIAEAAESGWVWITIEQARGVLELINYQDQHIEAFLRDQEPRLLKLEEVKAFGWDYCYLEEERLPGKEYRAVCGNYALTCITWPCVASMRIQHGDNSYGRKWRCWTAKPTEEQRKAVKWND